MEGFLLVGTHLAAFIGSRVPRKTLAAYLSTEYRISEPSCFTLIIGKRHIGLISLLKGHERDCATVVTAWNPYSEKRTRRQNEVAQSELVRELDRRRLPHFQGYGADPENQWPVEDSRLLLGLDLPAAAKLGRQFGQNAIVWTAGDALPLLVVLR